MLEPVFRGAFGLSRTKLVLSRFAGLEIARLACDLIADGPRGQKLPAVRIWAGWLRVRFAHELGPADGLVPVW